MPARFSSARFVGRERELARLAGALEAAVDGRSSTLLLAGSGGLGASRLLDEAERRIAALPEPICRRPLPGAARSERAIRTPRSRPGSRRSSPGSTIASSPRVAGIGAEELAKLLPGMVDRLGALGLLPARPTVTEPERRQTRMLESILGLLIRIGERAPVVLALEDLQSADAGTRALATFLARVSRPGRLCVLGDLPARRADPQPSAPDRARRDGRRRRSRRPSWPSSRSTATSSPSSSRGSRASARRRPSSSSSPSGRVATRSSPRSSWPPAASSPARR